MENFIYVVLFAIAMTACLQKTDVPESNKTNADMSNLANLSTKNSDQPMVKESSIAVASHNSVSNDIPEITDRSAMQASVANIQEENDNIHASEKNSAMPDKVSSSIPIAL